MTRKSLRFARRASAGGERQAIGTCPDDGDVRNHLVKISSIRLARPLGRRAAHHGNRVRTYNASKAQKVYCLHSASTDAVINCEGVDK